MLPVQEIEPQILAALRASNRLVLTAPTGSGKTTQVPQMLLRGGLVAGQVIVLQPRRLATRLVAQRVAHEMGGEVGAIVGYQTRHESKMGRDTRLRFMTEGLLVRLFQNDAPLRSVGAVILDEFHERNIAADISLGLLRRLQENGRADLKLIVMSATLDARAVAAYLGCETLEAGGRLHPLDIRYLPRRSTMAPWDLAAETLREALATQDEGHVLVFMPGAYEINRTLDACRRVAGDLRFFPLHGSLPPREQDAAVAPSRERKVIVATNVAETSITIDGVRCVIDSGLARVHRFDPARGINALRVEPVSRASTDQRAGRAGRTGPGVVYRLWTEADHHQVRESHEPPEVQRIELSEPLLQLRAMGVEDVAHFPWLDAPPPEAVERAEVLLRTLGATSEDGRLTDLGGRMSGFPLHPRLSRVLLEAERRGCLSRAITWAALVGDRDIALREKARELVRFEDPAEPSSDLAVRERALAEAVASNFDPRRCETLGLHGNTCRQVEQTAKQLSSHCRRAGMRLDEGTTADLIRALLAGFPDHVAMRIEARRPHCTLPGRKKVELDPASVVRGAGLLLAVEMSEIGRGDDVQTKLSLASRVEPGWLDPSRVQTVTRTVWNDETLAAEQVEEQLYDGLTLARTARPNPDPAAAAEMLVERIVSGQLKLEGWNEEVTQWIERTRCVKQWFPEKELIGYDPDDLRVILHEIVGNAVRFNQVKDRPCLQFVREALGWDDQQLVERMAPSHIALPSGFRMKLAYEPNSPPRGRAKIQDFYGLDETPRVAAGRQPVLLEILGPNRRPLQVTQDLANFWKTLYPQLRNELRRRYPRQEWR